MLKVYNKDSYRLLKKSFVKMYKWDKDLSVP